MRFAFGKNWLSFLSVLDEHRIAEACRALRTSLARENLQGCCALDIGSGSGLSSLAMRRLGANVTSFDYDHDSVACTAELRHRHGCGSDDWTVSQGSVLDPEYMAGLGQFDLVYAWGVLHHTGAMWPAIGLAHQRVAPGGVLLIALYNDQGLRSRAWRHIKRFYCSGAVGRTLISAMFFPIFALYTFAQDLRHLQMPGSHIRNYAHRRGMSIVHDWRDWLGGYPFEVAKPDDVVTRLSAAGFSLQGQTLTKGWGCNEFVFSRGTGPNGH
jgi:2-polyprenyl-3-methyl-5-hydroxy-6-metoxy-1,4-benzoquinol methylase